MILPLIAYWGIPRRGLRGSILPGWYSNSKSAEDRLKNMAVHMGRTELWMEIALEKINELVDTVNEQNTTIAELETRIDELEG